MSLAASLFLLAASASGSGADPLAQASDEWWHCYWPNEAEKTCGAIGKYKKTGPATYAYVGLEMIPRSEIVAERSGEITLADGKLCNVIETAPIRSARYLKGGRVLAGAERDAAMNALLRHIAPAVGMRVCSIPDMSTGAAEFPFRMEISGQPKPGYWVELRSETATARWIHKDDGYRVVAMPL